MEKRGKTILILGNGFDLAHGLPTKYSDFLEFCQRVEEIWYYDLDNRKGEKSFQEEWIDTWKTDQTIQEVIMVAYKERRVEEDDEVSLDNQELSEIHRCLDDNIWYEYFKKLYEKRCMRGENWIDFEAEIRFVIKKVDENSLSLADSFTDVIKKDHDFSRKLEILEECYEHTKRKASLEYKDTVKDFREKAFGDLERLTRALEVYLSAFVEKIPINDVTRIPELLSLMPDYVINFNYTHTYEKIYERGQVYHIHGEADTKRPAGENNMVLGIDEYWVGDERNEKTNFTIFKKFSQRIQKHTGNDSYKYLKEMRKIFVEKGEVWSGNVGTLEVHPDGVSNVYVFGHSLDVTDKDILSGFIGDNSTAVTIYCRDKGTEGELIANTIKLICEERVLDKSNYVPSKLKYIIQKKATKK